MRPCARGRPTIVAQSARPRLATDHEDGATTPSHQVSRMPDIHAVAAGYRESMTREMRIHAALCIPWVVSDDGRAFQVLLPGLPRSDVAASDAYAARIQAEHVHAPGTMAALSAWAQTTLGLSPSESARALGVTVATLRRWQRDETSPHGRQLRQCNALYALRALIDTVLPASGRAMRWLTTTPGLAGSTSPLDMIRAGAIAPLVWVLSTIDPDPF